MTNIINLNRGAHPDDEVPHIDVYGQVMLVGIFSDLCKIRDGKQDQVAVEGIVKRLGKVIERYEPEPAA